MRKTKASEVGSDRKRRLGGRSQRVQAAVFAATIDVLLERGYEGFRVSDAAARAGVNPTSVYRRWGTREALLTEALLSRVREELPVPHTGALRADLVGFLTSLAAFLQSPLGTALLQISTIGLHRPELAGYQQAYWRERASLVEEIFERALMSGEIPSALDATLTLELLAGPIYVRTLFSGQPFDRLAAERIVDRVLGAPR